MRVEQVRSTLRERIARGPTDSRRVRVKRVDAVRRWLGRPTFNGSTNVRRPRTSRTARPASRA